jgi:type II secretory pathway pseudopilin PulG
MKSEKGSSLLETIVALALLGIIGVVFLSATATSSGSRLVADEHTTARILAESQMENLKKQTYAFAYDPIAIPADYAGYSAIVDIDNMRNGNIQKLVVTIRHHDKNITTLESYKVNR